jgi:hypothetical protein
MCFERHVSVVAFSVQRIWNLLATEYEECGKTMTRLLPAPLGQAQSNVQGCCHVAAASSFCSKAQDAYDKLNCVDGPEN